MGKKIFILGLALIFGIVLFSCDSAVTPIEENDVTMLSKSKKGDNDCVTIQSGTLLTSDGDVIETGFDEWGYNYQGRMFKGGYCDSYRDADWCQPRFP